MKTQPWTIRLFITLAVGLSLILPATAQNQFGIGDVISIIGSQRGGSPSIGSIGRGRQNKTAAVIGLAGVIYQMSRQRQQQPQQYPSNIPYYPQPAPQNYPYPQPQNNPYPPQSYPSNGSSNYPGTSMGRPSGYAYIENHGRPIRLDPRILPLTINAGGGQGDQIISRSIQSWNNAGIGQVFALTNGQADLTIDWSGSKVSSGARAETRMIRSSTHVVPTDLSVRTSGRSGEQLVRVMTHELGHVLGLDHSRDRGDVMYSSEQNASSNLTARDVAMARWLYSQSSYSPVIGRTDMGQSPSMARSFGGGSSWNAGSFSGDVGQSICTMH